MELTSGVSEARTSGSVISFQIASGLTGTVDIDKLRTENRVISDQRLPESLNALTTAAGSATDAPDANA